MLLSAVVLLHSLLLDEFRIFVLKGDAKNEGSKEPPHLNKRADGKSNSMTLLQCILCCGILGTMDLLIKALFPHSIVGFVQNDPL
jgi:hypothetical protein